MALSRLTCILGVVLCLALTRVSPAFAVPQTEQEKLSSVRALVAERAETVNGNSAVARSGIATADEGSSLGVRMFQGLLTCLFVLGVGVFIYRKTAGKNAPAQTGRIQLVDRVAVTPRTLLVLARVDGKEVLLSVGPERVSFGYPQAGHTAGEEL